MQVTTVGIDLAKHVFQVHGITKDGGVVFNRAIRRAQLIQFFTKLEPCLIGMEAFGSSHYWARELTKLGHDVRLIPANYVKPYVKRGKSHADDAVCCAQIRGTAGRLVPASCARLDRQAANTTEQYASQSTRGVWCHHSTRDRGCGEIRKGYFGGRKTCPSRDRNRCPETTQPPTCCDAPTFPLVRDAHASAFEIGQTRHVIAHDPRRWACDRFSHCCHCRRREAV